MLKVSKYRLEKETPQETKRQERENDDGGRNPKGGSRGGYGSYRRGERQDYQESERQGNGKAKHFTPQNAHRVNGDQEPTLVLPTHPRNQGRNQL